LLANVRRLSLAAAVCAVAACSPHPGPTRDVVIVARGMAFVLEGTSEPNPVFTLRAGERVRLVLVNDAPGLLHDLVIPGLQVEIDQLRMGERGEAVLTVPDTPGRFEYHCRPHAAMMSGFVDVIR
jgi:plastocyanin